MKIKHKEQISLVGLKGHVGTVVREQILDLTVARMLIPALPDDLGRATSSLCKGPDSNYFERYMLYHLHYR